jgi:hypothetical protein
MRRRRNEQTVELRKNKREETLQKRRNVPSGELTDEEEGGNKGAPANLQLLVAQAASGDQDVQYGAVTAVRKLLSSDRNPPIDPLINFGILPILVNCLASTTK